MTDFLQWGAILAIAVALLMVARAQSSVARAQRELARTFKELLRVARLARDSARWPSAPSSHVPKGRPNPEHRRDVIDDETGEGRR